MRIRKNAKLSTSLMLSHASGGEVLLQSHVCQLNQSPWDVVPFSPHAFLSPLLHQFQGEDSFNGNGSLGDSIGAVESVASMMEDAARETKVDSKVVVDNDNHEIMEGGRKTSRKKLGDDYGETKIGSEFKFKKVRDCKNDESKDQGQSVIKNDDIKKPNKGNIITNGGGRRGRPKAAKKGGGAAAAGNPYEFYYYSGFGPLWGKRRGGGGAGDRKGNKSGAKDAEINKNNNNGTNVVSAAAIKNTAMSRIPSPSPIKHENKEEIDYVDDVEDYEDDEDDEECRGGDGGKKRMRKPVKARSLKSLM